MSRVYPRVCGGAPSAPPASSAVGGLSPRVRGSPLGAGESQTVLRSIPACAGEPPNWMCAASISGVYPRVCGGAWSAPGETILDPGLSPRVRGSRLRVRQHGIKRRSIPACAGEPKSLDLSPREIAVYPRVCGGAPPAVDSPVGYSGLSPRVRGSHTRSRNVVRGLRSIPACAGEPQVYEVEPGASGVYPRVCGGARAVPLRGEGCRGLSPRVRGSPFGHDPETTCVGSIPACAGEPPFRRAFSWTRWVYPRVCGGAMPVRIRCCGSRGLSPRVRGSPFGHDPETTCVGSIPACAGEP